MLNWLRGRRRRRIIAASAIQPTEWDHAFSRLPLLRQLGTDERRALRELAILFLHAKDLQGVGGLELTTAMRLTIALQACLPVLHLGLDWYDDWVSVLVYPDEFLVTHRWEDEDGVVHEAEGPLSGEAWAQGPVVLSWNDICDTAGDDAFNLVIHEFAHKLDMRSGSANGCPPLHRDMQAAAWTRALTAAYDDIVDRERRGEALPLDAYATESPAEFFAVASEAFFEQPRRLRLDYPEVYRQLAMFYRQDPATRDPGGGAPRLPLSDRAPTRG